ncbi:CPBP family intramembrane glutamic endopeptidase [Aromatoleum evansii]|uniref:CPBP family intramembrane glutamic endopeptidase n=1 Tax=Aromatoleum evansii TaxID=59406 RepID=A0ABZ1ATJ5_AROEV|nr:CPBP family intramembrane glutamic endopeptidase [Aromatoleum evansii]NMG32498.1 CPBP family intramembrane metalloprotease [Aromatoleum evansii]WRL48549.1 CPBP family intramembrane glutamic endopeptidase [Aromatoleum evansii]
MQRDPRLDALFNNFKQSPPKPAGPLQKLAAIAATVLVFGLALTFSVLFFAVVVAAGGLIWGYVWWKTRNLRKAMQQAQAEGTARRGPRSADNLVIEGEVLREIREEDHDAPRK